MGFFRTRNCNSCDGDCNRYLCFMWCLSRMHSGWTVTLFKDYTAVVRRSWSSSNRRGVQYTLAASSLELNNLTQNKEAVSETCLKSGENTLSYWIYRPWERKSMILLKNIGDIQYPSCLYEALWSRCIQTVRWAERKSRTPWKVSKRKLISYREQLNGSSKRQILHQRETKMAIRTSDLESKAVRWKVLWHVFV